MEDKPIFVTQPSLAPLEEYVDLLKTVWDSGVLTHNGPLVQRFEKELQAKLATSNMTVVTNGTIALQMAIRALELKGEIITSPFTWIATVSAIKWEGCDPVYCDIDPDTFNIDPAKIEACITKKTVAIMPVHVFGNPCDIDAIQAIADKYKLKVIYDAAHGIGSTYAGKSVLEFGDISATSLHATKLLNTGEGGACITNDVELDTRLKRIRFFGHNEQKDVVMDGFNGKLTEIHAALGLANLKYFDQVLEDRKTKYEIYKRELSATSGMKFQEIRHGVPNFSYFPLLFDTEELLQKVGMALGEKKIYPRRYFYPSVNTYTEVNAPQSAPISESIASRILCLPLYYQLSETGQRKVIETISKIKK